MLIVYIWKTRFGLFHQMYKVALSIEWLLVLESMFFEIEMGPVRLIKNWSDYENDG
jgi:hypothetical protein